jgi:predicted dehydrogenase
LDVIVTADPERSARAAADWPEAEVVDTVEAVWGRRRNLDFVVVATPNDAHAALTTRGLEEGLAVVVDKPLAPTAAQARRVLEAGASTGVPLTVFHNRRWDSDFLTLRRLIWDGELGEVRRFESRFERWRPEADAEAWRSARPREEGGGVLLDLGTHLVDQALVLFGPADDVHGDVHRRRGLPGDDDAFVEIRHRSGVVSHLWASTVSPAPGPRLRVLGSAAAFVAERGDGQEDDLRAGLRPNGDWGKAAPERWGMLLEGDEARAIEPEPGAWPDFYRRFEAMLRGKGEPPVDPRDALAVLEVLDRITGR